MGLYKILLFLYDSVQNIAIKWVIKYAYNEEKNSSIRQEKKCDMHWSTKNILRLGISQEKNKL